MAKEGLGNVIEEIVDFIRRNRRMLAELEEAHTRSVHGALEYSESQARAIVELAKSIIEPMKDIEERIFERHQNDR